MHLPDHVCVFELPLGFQRRLVDVEPILSGWELHLQYLAAIIVLHIDHNPGRPEIKSTWMSAIYNCVSWHVVPLNDITKSDRAPSLFRVTGSFSIVAYGCNSW